MRNVKRYGLLGNIEDAHYVKYTIDAARLAGLSSSLGVQTASRKPSCGQNNVASVAAGALVLERKSSVTTGDSDSAPGGKSGGGGREAANEFKAQRKCGGEGGGTGKGCAVGLGGPNSGNLDVSFLWPYICMKRADKHMSRNNDKETRRKKNNFRKKQLARCSGLSVRCATS